MLGTSTPLHIMVWGRFGRKPPEKELAADKMDLVPTVQIGMELYALPRMDLTHPT